MDYSTDPSWFSCSGGTGSPDLNARGVSSNHGQADRQIFLPDSSETVSTGSQDRPAREGPDGISEEANLIRFTGLDYDPDSELLFQQARSYDPTPGRWLDEEPIAFAASDANLRRYP